MKLYVARHTETTYNVEGICNADPTVDVSLTRRGRLQGTRLSQALSTVPLQHIVTSEFPRTQQTGEIINLGRNLPIEVDPRINENRTGFEGKPVRDWRIAVESSPDKWSFRSGNSETLGELYARIVSFVGAIAQSGFDDVLVVTHALPARMIQRAVDPTPRDPWEYVVTQGGYDIVEL